MLFAAQVVTLAVAPAASLPAAHRAFAQPGSLPASQDGAPDCPARPAPAAVPGGDIAVYRHPIEATVNEPFDVELRMIPGWRWQLVEPLDESTLRLVGIARQRSVDAQGQPMAGGGSEYWTFQPLCVGSSTILLQYREPSGRVYEYDVYDVVVR